MAVNERNIVDGSVKVLNIGISEKPNCGVHDYAMGFAEELQLLGHDVETLWCMTDYHPRRVLQWVHKLTAATDIEDIDVIIWHYSVFSYRN